MQNKMISCPICSKEGKPDFILGTYTVRYCRDCDFRWVENLYEEKLIENSGYYWGKDFFEKQDNYLRQIWKREIENIIEISGRDSGNWLDLGCSYGYLISEAGKKGFRATGVEAVGDVAAIAKNRENLNIVHSLLSGLELPAGSFDVITMFDILEHLQYPAQSLEKVTKLAKPGSLLTIEVPFEGSLFRKLSYMTYRLSRGKLKKFVKGIFHEHPGGHRLGFSQKALDRFLKAYRWEPLRFEKTMMPFRFFMNETFRKRNPLQRFFWGIVYGTLYFVSILIGMQNRIKVYAKKI
ncbi:MAG: methyltransferase domain-containing protein [Endomicrobiales bacterium]|nr:methyltransferase domain-containing protein [Endomicrobiales bacterium]